MVIFCKMNLVNFSDYFLPLRAGQMASIKKSAGVDRLYFSIISGRSGSTYLADVCRGLGFGKGEESFNELPLGVLEEAEPDRRFDRFLQQTLSDSVVNGTAYFQISVPRLKHLLELVPIDELINEVDLFTAVKRRNILSQAISFHNAQRTGLWHTNRELEVGSGEMSDLRKILAWVREINDMELQIGLLEKRLDIKTFYYEDIVSSPFETILIFLRYHHFYVSSIEMNRVLSSENLPRKIKSKKTHIQYLEMIYDFPWLQSILIQRMDGVLDSELLGAEIERHAPDILSLPV